jgi:hypothetical protein
MIKNSLVSMLVIFLSTLNLSAQESAAVKGDYEWIAGCVYLKFDAESPGSFRYVDLRAHKMVLVTMDLPVAGGAIRSMKAIFSRAGWI